MMKSNLNIIDLISEKHIVLRREVEDRWEAIEDEEISHTEALFLAKIEMGKISIAEVARQANISRQAMYKCAKKLETRGYLKFVIDEGNNKYTNLTEKGEEYCRRSKELKASIEREISDVLGEENIRMLKELLNKRWKK